MFVVDFKKLAENFKLYLWQYFNGCIKYDKFLNDSWLKFEFSSKFNVKSFNLLPLYKFLELIPSNNSNRP